MTTLVPNPEFRQLASTERIAKAVQGLEANGIKTFVADNGSEAQKLVLDLIPEGVEVFNARSRTLEEIGLAAEIEESHRYQPVRPHLIALDRATQAREIRKLGAAPDVYVGSAHAITEEGQILIASGGGSQLTPLAYGAGQVILVVSTQKLVGSLNDGFRRIHEYSFPLEDARLHDVYGLHSKVNKVLLINGELPGRITVVLVKENLGF
jgi:L-lactate utilization protein LutC